MTFDPTWAGACLLALPALLGYAAAHARGVVHPGRWRLAAIAHRRWAGVVVAMGPRRAARVRGRP